MTFTCLNSQNILGIILINSVVVVLLTLSNIFLHFLVNIFMEKNSENSAHKWEWQEYVYSLESGSISVEYLLNNCTESNCGVQRSQVETRPTDHKHGGHIRSCDNQSCDCGIVGYLCLTLSLCQIQER